MRSRMEKWYEDKKGRPGTLDEQVDLVVRYYNEYRKGRDPDDTNDDAYEHEVGDEDILDDGSESSKAPSVHSFKDKIEALLSAEDVEDVFVVVNAVTADELRREGRSVPTKALKLIEEYSDYPDVVSLARKLQRTSELTAPSIIKMLIRGGVPGKAIRRVDDHTVYVTFPDRYQFRLDTKTRTVQLGIQKGGSFDLDRKFKLSDKFVTDLVAAYKKREKSRIQLGRAARHLAGATPKA